jgi:hypothetical protein
MVGVALIGVREVLDVENLELAILLDKGEDGDAVIPQRGTADGGPRRCELQMTACYNPRGHDNSVGTNVDDNFPLCFNHFEDGGLEVMNISQRARGMFRVTRYVLQLRERSRVSHRTS